MALFKSRRAARRGVLRAAESAEEFVKSEDDIKKWTNDEIALREEEIKRLQSSNIPDKELLIRLLRNEIANLDKTRDASLGIINKLKKSRRS